MMESSLLLAIINDDASKCAIERELSRAAILHHVLIHDACKVWEKLKKYHADVLVDAPDSPKEYNAVKIMAMEGNSAHCEQTSSFVASVSLPPGTSMFYKIQQPGHAQNNPTFIVTQFAPITEEQMNVCVGQLAPNVIKCAIDAGTLITSMHLITLCKRINASNHANYKPAIGAREVILNALKTYPVEHCARLFRRVLRANVLSCEKAMALKQLGDIMALHPPAQVFRYYLQGAKTYAIDGVIEQMIRLASRSFITCVICAGICANLMSTVAIVVSMIRDKVRTDAHGMHPLFDAHVLMMSCIENNRSVGWLMGNSVMPDSATIDSMHASSYAHRAINYCADVSLESICRHDVSDGNMAKLMYIAQNKPKLVAALESARGDNIKLYLAGMQLAVGNDLPCFLEFIISKLPGDADTLYRLAYNYQICVRAVLPRKCEPVLAKYLGRDYVMAITVGAAV